MAQFAIRKDVIMDKQQKVKSGSFKDRLDKTFKITERGSTIRTEIIAGLTTFFAMAYIVVTNPNQVVGFNKGGEFDKIWFAVYVASILVAVIGTLLMSLYAKMPFAQACGMGLNSFFFVSFIVPQFATGEFIKGYHEGLAVILMSGIVFMILSLTGAREFIARSLPDNLKKAIPAGIGLFIALLGFKSVNMIQGNQYTLVQFFDFKGIIDAVGMNLAELSLSGASGATIAAYESYLNYDYTAVITGLDAWRIIAPVILTIVGLCVMAILSKKKVTGSVIYTILGTTVVYYLATWQAPNFSFTSIGDSFKAFGEIGIFGAFKGFGTVFSAGEGESAFAVILGAIVLVITFTLVDMFDTLGTLYGAASQANMLDENGDPINLKECMNSDSIATAAGAVLGTSTCTTFVESSAGVGVGGRTGLASLVTAGCFLACLFLTPIATIIPACATAPALVYIGVLMLKGFAKVDMEDLTSAVPAFLALIMMPLTYSISNGIAIGAISYVLIRLFTGKYQKKDIVITIIAILFGLRFFLVSM